MPYILKKERKQYEEILNKLSELLKDTPDGHKNYVISTLLKNIYSPPSYDTYNRAIGILECVKQEFYRRMVAPYEDKKIEENGDVYK